MTFSSSPPPMKMAGVATMNSYFEFIVGFLYAVKSPRLPEKSERRGYQNSHFHESIPLL